MAGQASETGLSIYTHMEKKSSNWYFPPDLGCLLFSWIWIVLIMVLGGGILSLVSRLRSGDVLEIFYVSLGCSGIGTILLFLARLPLYRQRQFFSVGPWALDRSHRRLYWLAYVFIFASLGLLAIVWLRVK
jgi:hypothetical protein